MKRDATKRTLLAAILTCALAFAGCSKAATSAPSGKDAPLAAAQREGTSTAEVFIVNLNKPGDEAPLVKGIQMPDYGLYGYNVLDSGYINTQDVKIKHPILDAEKVEPKLFGEVEDKTSQGEFAYSDRINTFYSNFNSKASVGYKGVAFSGNVSGEFNLKKQTSAHQTFIRYIQYHTLYRRFFSGEDEQLLPMLSEQFKKDAIAFQNDPNQLFDKYGTHLITDYFVGGRADLNFVFNNTSSSTEEQIKASVDAAYGRISGSGSADSVEKSKLVMTNSTLSVKTYGGKFVSGSTVEELSKQFPEWVESIQDAPNVCRLGRFEDSMFPVWKLIEDPAISKKYQDEFNRQAAGRQIELDGLVDIPAPAKNYIVDIVVLDGTSEKSAKAKLPAGYTPVYQNPGSADTDWLEANNGARGDFIYIAYKIGTDKSRAIAEIATAAGKDTTLKGYTKIDVDLNRGARGDYVYLFYRRALGAEITSPNTTYLKAIRGNYGKLNSFTLPSGWQMPPRYVDLNKGTPKGGQIYLAVTKGP